MKDLEAPIKKPESHPFHSAQLNNRKWISENVKAAMTDFTGEYHIDHLMADHIAWYVVKNLPEKPQLTQIAAGLQTAQIQVEQIKFEYKEREDSFSSRFVLVWAVLAMFIFAWIILS